MVGRKKGTKNKVSLPSSYEIGDGAINLCLAILSKARASESQMWVDFQKTELYQGKNKDPLSIAVWVGNYIGEDK